jgi:hypothetical protein
MSSRTETMRRARRVLRSLERARVARRRLPGFEGGDEAASDIETLYHAVRTRLAVLQRGSLSAPSALGMDELARLLARAEQKVGGA